MTEQKGTPYTTAVHLPVNTSNTAWLHCSGFTRGTTPENMRTAHHAFDGDLHTCWVHGAGDALVYDFHRPVPVVSYTLAGYERSHCVVRIDCTACLTHRQLCRHGQLRFANVLDITMEAYLRWCTPTPTGQSDSPYRPPEGVLDLRGRPGSRGQPPQQVVGCAGQPDRRATGVRQGPSQLFLSKNRHDVSESQSKHRGACARCAAPPLTSRCPRGWRTATTGSCLAPCGSPRIDLVTPR
jgi:hypothetical protein